MTKADCTAYLHERGWRDIPKSACYVCPYAGDDRWIDIRDNQSKEWAKAVAFDEAVRHGAARGQQLNGTAYLHRTRLPLVIAPLRDARPDPDGCSPYACRSGHAVDAVDVDKPADIAPAPQQL
jgi:hypothetical protein